MHSFLIFYIVTLLFSACSSNSIIPTRGPHSQETPVLVPYAPLPMQVQILPRKPSTKSKFVWIDGQWIWNGTLWIWEEGHWEAPPKNAHYYALPLYEKLSDGQILWLKGSWK